ncbi:uncharacterized protein Z518_08333 [Rhinocladiella mackenziei CBS 650.93]|uniref:Uncharacterized protein n=1 Tax=Rhinocladiella mackenziei CBS 650.93 TaxID=1442369 RepID=A0A0D2FK97_9EURO|nr:uncharacterized protein Z518_08333 [Rhinocladiella mackenziei CBS 650.93]KIX02392.1 hypothetical protein Z518_08333 [Rhinocladiella mackenziei CBS 650.93]
MKWAFEDDFESRFRLMLFQDSDVPCQVYARILKLEKSCTKNIQFRVSGNDDSAHATEGVIFWDDICNEIRKVQDANLDLHIYVDRREQAWVLPTSHDKEQQFNTAALLSLQEVMSRLKSYDQKR